MGSVTESTAGPPHLNSVEERAEHAVGDDRHDGGGEQYADDDGEEGLLPRHVQEACDEGAGPCAGARERDADEEHEAPEIILLNRCLVLLDLLTELSRDPLCRSEMLTGQYDLLDEEKDQRDRQEISNDAEDQCTQIRHAQQRGCEESATELQDRHQGNDEDDGVLREESRQVSSDKAYKCFHF